MQPQRNARGRPVCPTRGLPNLPLDLTPARRPLCKRTDLAATVSSPLSPDSCSVNDRRFLAAALRHPRPHSPQSSTARAIASLPRRQRGNAATETTGHGLRCSTRGAGRQDGRCAAGDGDKRRGCEKETDREGNRVAPAEALLPPLRLLASTPKRRSSPASAADGSCTYAHTRTPRTTGSA